MAGLQDFDGRINHILGKLEREGKTEVINELSIDVDCDVLQELRERVFNLGKETYESKLRDANEIGDEEHVDLFLQKRKKNENETLAKDIVELYQYAVGLSLTFPKDVLTRTCTSKLKDTADLEDKSGEKDQVKQWKELLSGKNKQSIHQRIFNTEMKNLVKDLESKIEMLVKDAINDRRKISDLEKSLNEANLKITLLSSTEKEKEDEVVVIDETNQPDPENPLSDKSEASNGQHQEASTAKATGQCQVCTHHQLQPLSPPPPPQKSPTPVTRSTLVSTVTEDNGTRTTYFHKAGTPGSLPIEQQRRNQRMNNQPSKRRLLRGATKEKGINMYLSGILLEGDETDEEVVNIVKEHAWNKGIRLMGHRVVRTKRYPYVVGCKIMLPESQEYIALTPDTWPRDVVCRKWEPAWRRKGYDSYEGYKSSYYGNDDNWW